VRSPGNRGTAGRWLCRAGLHSRTPAERVEGTCRREIRCRRCDRLLRSETIHDWDDGSEKDARCSSVVTCRRCAAERNEFRHRNREVVAADLRPGDRAVLSNLGAPGPCDVIAICLDCGSRSTTHRESHDEEAEPPYRCRRCGHWYDDGEA
jgi:DNA-directed RNA polymerase subunit RPC12/RpoP